MPFLKWLIKGDKKWVIYDNVIPKRAPLNHHKQIRRQNCTKKDHAIHVVIVRALYITICYLKAEPLILRFPTHN